MNPAQSLLSTSFRERSKRSYDGTAMNTNVGGLIDGLRRHKVDKRSDASDTLCNTARQNDISRVVIRSGCLNSDWLGLWRVPLQNPFNLYGTLPSKTRSRDKRKAFSMPPLEDFPMDTSKDSFDTTDTFGSTKLTRMQSDDTSNHCVDVVQRQRLLVPRSLQMQRINTILSDPKSRRSSITASTARSTIDSFRLSDSFDECIITTSPGQASSKHLEMLMNNLYLITRNGFLSGSLPENPWGNKDQVDADFIAISLARRHDSNPCLRLFNDLEAIVSMPSRYHRYKVSDITNLWKPSQAGNYMAPTCIDFNGGGGGGGGSMDERVYQSPIVGRLLLPRSKSQVMRAADFQITSEDDMLLWNASTDSARATMRKSGIIHRPVKYDINDDFMVTDADDYAVLQTRFGRIIYSPKFKDDHYMYRFVVLTKEAQEAVEALSRTSPKHGRVAYSYANPITGKRCLTEFEIVRQLGIQMSPGWEHFMYFKNSQKELVLRKPL